MSCLHFFGADFFPRFHHCSDFIKNTSAASKSKRRGETNWREKERNRERKRQNAGTTTTKNEAHTLIYTNKNNEMRWFQKTSFISFAVMPCECVCVCIFAVQLQKKTPAIHKSTKAWVLFLQYFEFILFLSYLMRKSNSSSSLFYK